MGMKEILHRQKFTGHFSPSSPASLLDISAGDCHIALVDE
jgi:hypothetical protein